MHHHQVLVVLMKIVMTLLEVILVHVVMDTPRKTPPTPHAPVITLRISKIFYQLRISITKKKKMTRFNFLPTTMATIYPNYLVPKELDTNKFPANYGCNAQWCGM